MKRLLFAITVLTILLAVLAVPVFTSCNNTGNNTTTYNTLTTPSTLEQTSINVVIGNSSDYIYARPTNTIDKLRTWHIILGILVSIYVLLKVVCLKKNN